MMMRRASSRSRGDVASTSAASRPPNVPDKSRPRPNAVPIITNAPRAIGRRSLHSEMPNTRYDAATFQYERTGLFIRSWKLKLGVT